MQDETLKLVREMVRHHLAEALDHAAIRSVTNLASGLYKAIEAFEQKVGDLPAVQNSVQPDITSLKGKLGDMLQNPAGYVTKQGAGSQMKKVDPPVTNGLTRSGAQRTI